MQTMWGNQHKIFAVQSEGTANRKQFPSSGKLLLCWFNITVRHEISSEPSMQGWAVCGHTSQNDRDQSAAEHDATRAPAQQHPSSEARNQSVSVEQPKCHFWLPRSRAFRVSLRAVRCFHTAGLTAARAIVKVAGVTVADDAQWSSVQSETNHSEYAKNAKVWIRKGIQHQN